MNLSFLPQILTEALSHIDINKLYDLRLRKNCPVTVNYAGKNYYLTQKGTSTDTYGAIVLLKEDLSKIIKVVTEYSIYSKNDNIKNGFITTADGVRIGLCGECVESNGNVLTIKDITSLTIRIPHQIDGAATMLYKMAFSNGVKNLLIISPPGYGKTTVLKDFIRIFSADLSYNVLIIDERGELYSERNYRCDYIRYCSKLYAFSYGIRSMSPDIIIADEMSEREDFLFAMRAVNSGVKIIATAHGTSISDIKQKDYYTDNVFDVFAVLKSDFTRGQIKEVLFNG